MSNDSKPKKHSSSAITINVTAETNAGGRRHMEDFLAVKLRPQERFQDVSYLREQAYFGVFDGHGGKEAARFTRDRLWDVIQDNPKYQKPDAENICAGLTEAFEAVHKEMEPMRATWKTNKMGDLSTAGTTASIIIFRQNHIFVANVGDSTTILGEVNPKAGEPGQHAMVARVLTKDHKPGDPEENRLVERLGGRVMISRKGVPRVVWERRGVDPDGDERIDFIPFLSVSRALGDFWSFCPSSGKYAVSPTPDVHFHPLNPVCMKFVVIASDGLWNVMTPKEVVEFIWDYEQETDESLHQPRDVVKAVINEALSRWKKKQLLADNISVVIAFIIADDLSAWEKGSTVNGESSSSTGHVSPPATSAGSSMGESSASTASPPPTAPSPTSNSGSTGESSGGTVSPAASADSSSVGTINGESSGSPASTSASPTPSSGSTVTGESAEVRRNPTPPPTTSSAQHTSPPKSPSPSSSSSSHSSSAPPSLLPDQSQEQQDQSPPTISSVHTTRNGTCSTCTSDYKETFSDGVIVEFHTEVKHRHRKKHKHHSSHSKGTDHSSSSNSDVDASQSSLDAGTSSPYSLDPIGSLKRSPLKRERSEEDASTSSEPLQKRSKLDLPDSGCDCSADKMESENSSPPTDRADPMDHEHSSGVECDDSEGRNNPAENSKSDACSNSAFVDGVSSPVSSSTVSVS